MLLVSLIIAASGLSSVLIINDSAKQSYASTNTLLVPNVSFQVVATSSAQALTKQDYAHLRRLGFTNLVAISRAREYIYAPHTQQDKSSPGFEKVVARAVDFTGIDTFALPTNLSATKGDSQGEMSKNSRSQLTGLSFTKPVALVHPTQLAMLTEEFLSRQLVIQKQGTNGTDESQYNRLPKLVPLEEASLGNDIIMDMGMFTQLFPNSPLISLLWMQDPNEANFDLLREELESKLPAHLSLRQLSSANAQGELTKSFHINLLAMALLMFVVCLFIVLNAVNLLINSRMPWLRICRQLGIPRITIFTVLLIEIILLTLVTVIAGMVLGLYLSNIVSPSVHATLEGLYNVQVGFGEISLLSLFIQVFGISIIGSIGAVLLPFKQLNTSLAQTSTVLNHKSLSKMTFFNTVSPYWFVALVFAISAIILLTTSTQLWLLLIATACLILAGCAVLLASYPLALKTILSTIPKRFTLLRVSTQQSIVLSGKTKIACCAFFIAATSNIGMNLMVDSFRVATVSWLDSRLASDYYLYYRGDKDLSKAAVQANVLMVERFENIVTYKEQKVQQYSFPTTQKLRQSMVFYKVKDEKQAWQAFKANQAIFVNQQFAFYFGLDVGDKIQFPHPTSAQLTEYEIQAIVYDFGNTYKQALLPLSAFSSALSKSPVYAIEANDLQIEQFKDELDLLGIDYSETLLKTEQLLSMSMEAFDNTFLITDGLNIVSLLVAALSLACAIIVLMDDVRPQNMLIRSFGVSSFKTQMLALFQYLLLCLVALIFATPFGILLSWVLIFDINYQAFHWTYPLHVEPLKIMQIYWLSLAVVVSVIAIPLLRASKKPLIEDIRWLN